MDISSNKLGHITAESDAQMLNDAFYESPDYRTLIESNDKIIVIGRRGTGKSALTYKLERVWGKWVFRLSPTEDQMLGMRPFLKNFHDNYELIKATTRICWEASICLHLLGAIVRHYKFQKCDSYLDGKRIVSENFTYDKNVSYTSRSLLKKCLTIESDPELVIAEMCDILELSSIKNCLHEFLKKTNTQIKILIDCLDEGYKPDTLGISHISGVLQSVLNINAEFEAIRPIVFIRDNMFRAVSKVDPDYTRNMEGTSLRLHWGENDLTHMVAFRLKSAFGIGVENDLRIWNSATTGSLASRDGFKRCLRMTLYRPRDIIALLNQAFYLASREQRSRISDADIENTSKEISELRLGDLKKEYSVIFPAIDDVISIFKGMKSTFSIDDISGDIDELMHSRHASESTQRDLVFFENPIEILSALYSIGFIGVKDKTTDVYSFSHDGKSVSIEIDKDTKFHIHPCYQRALTSDCYEYSPDDAEEIHDDYEIRVDSLSRPQRNKKIGQLISKIREIEVGHEDSSKFEEWCFECISTIFPTELDNIRLNPNVNAPQKRDIVGTVSASKGVWRRIYDDYGSRAVLFEIKNFVSLKPDHYRQVSSYLNDHYGNIGFVIYRSEKKEPSNDNELTWIREIYWKNNPKKLVVVFSYKHLITFLEKIRNPDKYDAIDKILNRILDDYHQRYLNEPVGKRNKRGS